MPVSKNRRKNGKKVKHSAAKRTDRLEQTQAGVSLQDLINVVAYQEYVKDGTIVPDDVEDIPTVADIDFDDPDVAAVIHAVDKAGSTYKIEENEDER